MRRNEYEKICSAVDSGVERFVENHDTGEIGRIISCRRDRLQVDIYGRSDEWEKESCEIRGETGHELPGSEGR